MSNSDPINERLGDLFAEGQAPKSKPDAEAQVAAEKTQDMDEQWLEAQLSSLDISTLKDLRQRVGWEDFLNAIDRSERMGFFFDEQGVSSLGSSSEEGKTEDADGQVVEVPLQISDEILGAMKLEGADSLPEGTAELVSSIAQQVSQHVENLRLLAQAEQYRAEAEQATRRLTHEGWQQYLQSSIAPNPGYFYNRNQVVSLDAQAAGLKSDGKKIDVVDLLVRGQPIGEISVADAKESEQKSTELISTIANRLSGHVENLRLLDETERNLRQAEILRSASSALVGLPSHRDVLQFMVTTAKEAVGCDSGVITRWDKGRDALIVEAITITGSEGFSQEEIYAEWIGREYPLHGFDMTRKALEELTTIVINADDPQANSQELQRMKEDNSVSDLMSPIILRGEAIGLLELENESESRHYTDDEIQLVKALCNQIAVSWENIELFSRTEKRAVELETVAQVSTAAATILDPQALLQSVVDLTQYSFDLYFVSVFLIEQDHATLTFQAGPGKVGEQMLAEQSTLKLGQKKSVIAKAARTREVVIVDDATTHSDFMHHPLLPDTLSEMALPMIVADELIGIFDVQDVNLNRFSDDDIRTFSTLASQTAVALRNAQLYAEQMETVQRLRELDELKSSFLANMSHELRTPLNSIIGFTQVIMEGLDGPLTEDMETDLQSIHGSGQHLLSLINDVLDMAKIEAGKLALTLDSILLPEMLEHVLQTLGSLAVEKSLSLELDSQMSEDLVLMADSVRLRQIFINVIGNAIKFTEQGGVMIEAEKVKDSILISVVDTGIGIPQENLVSIFEAFSQVDTSTTRKAGGTGLGLPISRRLVEMHGGRIWAESDGVPGEGSVFRIELPIKAIEQDDQV